MTLPDFGARRACPGRCRPLLAPMSLRILPSGFVPPCLPTTAKTPPTGGAWLHEIKHDGFRMLVRRDAAGVRLFTRNGHDWTDRFPLIARAALSLKAARDRNAFPSAT